MTERLLTEFVFGEDSYYFGRVYPVGGNIYNLTGNPLRVKIWMLVDEEKEEKRKNLQDRINDLEAQAEGLRVEMEGL